MTPQEALAAEPKALEELLLVPEVRKSTGLTELLVAEFVEVGSSGRAHTKDDVVPSLRRSCQSTRRRRTSLSLDVALLTYKVLRHSQPAVDTVRSSVRRRRRATGKWSSTKGRSSQRHGGAAVGQNRPGRLDPADSIP